MSDRRRRLPPAPARTTTRKTGTARRIAALCILLLGASSCTNSSYPDWWPTEPAPAASGQSPAVAPPAPEPDRSVAEVQRLLARLGYEPGPADGILGPRSKAAIERYRSDRSLPPAASIDSDLVGHLRADLRDAERRRTITYRSAAQRPDVEAGDIYVYSDGTVETVLRREGPRVWWKNRDDTEYLGYVNFLIPRWQRNGDIPEPPRIDADPDGIWPDPEGTPVSFRVTAPSLGASVDISGTPQEWTCAIRWKLRIEVPAGQIDTLVIGCDRSPAPVGEWRQRIWYYSPAMRHFVRREDRMADGARSRPVELVAVRPGGAGWPPAARAGLDWALEQALENGPDARPTKWMSSAIADSFMIRALNKSTSEIGGGNSCLSYVQQRFPERRYRVYAGLACKDAVTGGWTIPFLGAAAPPLIPVSN